MSSPNRIHHCRVRHSCCCNIIYAWCSMLGLRASSFSMSQFYEKIPLVLVCMANDEKGTIDLPLPAPQSLHPIDPRIT